MHPTVRYFTIYFFFLKCPKSYNKWILIEIFNNDINRKSQKMNQNIIKIIVSFVLLMLCTQSYFMDFVALSGAGGVASGTIIKREGGIQQSYYFGNNKASGPTSIRRNLQQQSINRFEYYFGRTNTNNYVYNLSRTIVSQVNSDFKIYANNHPDMQGVRNMYLALGIPNYIIEIQYVPYLAMMMSYFDSIFSNDVEFGYNQVTVRGYLYQNIKEMQRLTDDLVDKYLRGVKMIIYGSNNRAIGQKLFISTDNMNVNAENTFIYNGNRANNQVTGRNIMRTKRYQFNFDEAEAILRGQVSRCIQIMR